MAVLNKQRPVAVPILLVTILAGCATQPQPFVFQPKYDCRITFPLTFVQDLPTMEVRVTGTRRQATVLRFLLNPGLPHTTLLQTSCPKLGCSGVKKPTLTLGAEAPRKTPMLMEWGGKDLGNKTFTIGEPASSTDAERLQKHGLDGTLGADILLDQEIVLNFRDGAVCFPSSELGRLRWVGVSEVLFEDRADFLTDKFISRKDLKSLIVGLSPAGGEHEEPRVFIGR